MLILVGMAIVAIGLAAIVALGCAMVAAWVHTGPLPRLGVGEAIKASLSPKFWSSDPASAYPRDVQRLLPGGWGFWTTGGLVFVLLVATFLAAVREIADRMAQTV